MKKLPIGRSDFKKIITQDYCYVDKTLFIKDIIDKGDDILLVPRPRRFGKTLNLSMLKYFYDCCPEKGEKRSGSSDSYKKLFDSLAITKAGKKYLDKMGKYPVIFISFRDAKEMEWETCISKIRQIIQDEYLKHDYLLNSPKLKPQEKDYFNRVINLKGNRGDYEKSLEKLLVFLSRYYGERVVILIDEYDAPVYAGFNHGYYDVYTDEDLLWSFLLMGGYLKQTGKRRDAAAGKMYYTLLIPNMEVRTTYTRIIDRYFSSKIENEKLEIMLKALIEGDIKLFEKMLRKVVRAVFSYHDFSGEPGKVYHALVAGLLIWISNTHEVKSNRESGYGRYDIMIIPKGPNQVGCVMEFKTVDKEDHETVETAAAAALAQIEEKKYETELIERGIENIKKLAVVFSGKDVYVKENETCKEECRQ